MQDLLAPFIAAEKPNWMSGTDCLVMVCLLAETTLEKPRTWLSQTTIGNRTGLCRSAVTDALKKLKTEGWIKTVSGKRLYNANSYETQFHNLPTAKPTVTTPSDEAVALATVYRDMFLRHCTKYVNRKGRTCHRKLRADWKKRWS